MFTGLVQELGTVQAIRKERGLVHLTVNAPKTAAGLQVGESVAVNGVCLSVVRNQRGACTFEMIPETQRLTTLGSLRIGARVNVERSLTLSDRLNGHVVLGHVDGVGTIVRRQQRGADVELVLQVGRSLRRLVVPKGPIALDGVSLTVGARLTPTACPIYLIPETVHRTTLGFRRVGDRVNIELDYLAKVVTQALTHR